MCNTCDDNRYRSKYVTLKKNIKMCCARMGSMYLRNWLDTTGRISLNYSTRFYVTATVFVNTLIIKPTRCTNFSNLFFGIKLYMFQTVPLSITRSFSLYTPAMVYVIQVCWQLASRIRTELVPVWHIPLLCVQWKTPDDGQRKCPKHVELYSKNKYEKLVHLVGFIIRIYHDATSPERQIFVNNCFVLRRYRVRS